MAVAFLVAVFATLLAVLYGMLVFLKHSPRAETEAETKYMTNDGKGAIHSLPPRISSKSLEGKLPGPKSSAEIELSVVVPSYNETARLRKMLDDAVVHLEGNYSGKYEILIVDDASKDGTGAFALSEATRLGLAPHVLKVVTLTANRGKGGAVAHGILHGRGNLLLFADADGATQFSDVEKLAAYMATINSGPGVAIGSRAHMINTDAVVKRSFIRNLLMYGLHVLVYIFGIRNVQDTQCGFKMFNRKAAGMIFPHMHTERWIFDVEILLLAELQRVPIGEIPVNWQEVDGSKVDLAKDSIQMAVDLVVTRMAYLLGIYSLNECDRLRK
ncbi:hypothetical protein JCM33374_g4219 [Metschnikowia sp. JCM 33374]|nr:hypothetical protein JCM33374_g4219 [Metschnikowia sp. JCM 33374]